MKPTFVDTFSGNGYAFGSNNLLDRYYADDDNVIVVGKDAEGKKIKKEFVRVIFYGLRQVRLCQYPYNSGKKFPKCFSTNYETPTGGEEKQDVKSCNECPLKEWSKNDKDEWVAPECSEVLETIVFDVDTQNYAIIQFKKTSRKVWSQIEKLIFQNLMKMQGYNNQVHPMQQFVIRLTSIRTTTGGMEHAIFAASIECEVANDKKQKHAIAAQTSYGFLLERNSGQLLIEAGQDYDDSAPPEVTAPPISSESTRKKEHEPNEAQPPIDKPPF